MFPNPFKECQEEHSSRQFRHTKSTQKRVVSPTCLLSPLPPLTEIGFRLLFSSESGAPTVTNHADRRLALYNDFPLWDIPPHLGRVFDAIHPGSMPKDAFLDPGDEQPSLGLCPSPRHAHSASVFVEPAEERYTWESLIAGVDLGAKVPLKWRGCLRGCLDFLDPEDEAELVAAAPMEIDEEHGEQDGVTLVQFTPSAGFGIADFEDGE